MCFCLLIHKSFAILYDDALIVFIDTLAGEVVQSPLRIPPEGERLVVLVNVYVIYARRNREEAFSENEIGGKVLADEIVGDEQFPFVFASLQRTLQFDGCDTRLTGFEGEFGKDIRLAGNFVGNVVALPVGDV